MSVDELEDVRPVLTNGWHPNVFEDAALSPGGQVYRFAIDIWTGLRHTGLPGGFEAEPNPSE